MQKYCEFHNNTIKLKCNLCNKKMNGWKNFSQHNKRYHQKNTVINYATVDSTHVLTDNMTHNEELATETVNLEVPTDLSKNSIENKKMLKIKKNPLKSLKNFYGCFLMALRSDYSLADSHMEEINSKLETFFIQSLNFIIVSYLP